MSRRSPAPRRCRPLVVALGLTLGLAALWPAARGAAQEAPSPAAGAEDESTPRLKDPSAAPGQPGNAGRRTRRRPAPGGEAAGRPGAPGPGAADGPPAVAKEPAAWRVYQRDRNDRADIPIVFEGGVVESATIVSKDQNGQEVEARYSDGKLLGVPAGGPYTVTISALKENVALIATVENVFVGDLWLLAGQSNMEGVGDLIDVTPPHPKVALLGMDGRWTQAEEPLHWLVDSPDPVHSGDPATQAERSAKAHKTRVKGAGLGLAFASTLANTTSVPVGLVAAAHGGTSMAQWDPAKKDEEGKSLYGSMLRQFRLAGGKVKGVLWYQGESDALAGDEAAAAYPKAFADFIGAVRADFNQPDLPFYLVQIGRFINPAEPKNWNAVQEAQRLIPEQVANTAVVSVIDLELDDLIHVGTQGLKRTGGRLARVAARELFGQVGATTPTLDRVTRGANNTLVVRFKGVNMGPAYGMGRGGFAGMGGMGQGMGGMGGGVGPAVGGGGGFRQMGVGGGMGGTFAGQGPLGGNTIGLRPERHIAGFSIRDAEGKAIPLIFDAAVGQSRDTVVLKLTGPVPAGANLWYGYGLDPYCNLVDGHDMAVPVFGPLPLDRLK